MLRRKTGFSYEYEGNGRKLRVTLSNPERGNTGWKIVDMRTGDEVQRYPYKDDACDAAERMTDED
jgi:hypothetical protein